MVHPGWPKDMKKSRANREWRPIPQEEYSLMEPTEIDYEAILLALKEAEYQRMIRIENDKVKYKSKFPENYKGGCNEGTH
jgi:hypothetical protein